MPVIGYYDRAFFPPGQYNRLVRMVNKVTETRKHWTNVPIVLRPLAEDMSSIPPSWLKRKLPAPAPTLTTTATNIDDC